jgi:Extracellular link domain/F5/8 type C domain
MFPNIAFIFIVLLLILFVYSKTVKEGFLNDPVGLHNEYVASSQKKYDTLTSMVNPLEPSIPMNPSSASTVRQAVNPLTAIPTSDLYTLTQENRHLYPDDISSVLKQAKACEASTVNTCDAFNDPTFAKNCGMSFDINALSADGKPHIGGLYLSPNDRNLLTSEAKKVRDNGLPPYDPYKVYKPTLGKSKPGTFGITKDTCIVVKEKVDCEAKQTFSSPNCTQCFTSQDFARVGPDTGRIPSILMLCGQGRVSITGSISLNLVTLDPTTPQQIAIPGNSEGTTFTITANSGSPVTYVSGYIQGETPSGTFKLDIINVIQSDTITNGRPRVSGTKSVNGFRCMAIVPGTGKASISLACLIPFSFMNMYDGDALTCSNGPIITQAASATFLESNPCYGKENKPGNYKLECLQARWLNMGGTPEGTGYPNTKEKANKIQLGPNGEKYDIDTIVDNLSGIMQQALTGVNNGQPMSIPEWNAASMYATGVPINTPCDGPGAGSQRCASYLYTNQGAGTRIGQTYSATASQQASKKEGFVDESFVDTFNYPSAPLDPNTAAGKALAASFNSIDALKQHYDAVNQTANNNNLSNEQRAGAIQQAYGINLAPKSAGKKPGPTQVFAVGPGYIYPQSDAAAVCAKYGAQVATTAQLEDAQRKGANWCFSGWVAEGSGKWPINESAIPGCGGRTGIIEWTPGPNAGVNCYGPKPNIEDVPAGTIIPFNSTTWDDPTQVKNDGMMGRYIKLQYNHVDCLNLAGIEVYSKKRGKNIVTPQTVVRKSSGYYGDQFPNQNYVDGNNNTFVHSSCGDVPWIQIDLGSVKPIYKVIIINRYDCCQSRILGSKLIIYDGNGSPTYNSENIVSVNQNYTWFPPSTTVYGDIPADSEKTNDEGPWKCLPGIPVPLRKNVMGDVECMSFNYRDCLWQGSEGACQALNNNKPASLAPLACGEMHNRVWGGSGYEGGHWCANAKPQL